MSARARIARRIGAGGGWLWGSTRTEMGLLGLAFHPNFRQNGYLEALSRAVENVRRAVKSVDRKKEGGKAGNVGLRVKVNSVPSVCVHSNARQASFYLSYRECALGMDHHPLLTRGWTVASLGNRLS